MNDFCSQSIVIICFFFSFLQILFFFFKHHAIITIRMSSANSFLSSTAYHTTNNRYSNSQSPTYNVQQQLNDLNSTRSSTSSCSTSHCLSNQCIECTTILSTRNLNSYIDQTSNSSQYGKNIFFKNLNKNLVDLVLYKIVPMYQILPSIIKRMMTNKQQEFYQ